MNRLSIILIHVAGIAATIFAIVRAGERPQVLLYAFIADYLLRLATIAGILKALREERFIRWRDAARLMFSLPVDGQQSYPVTRGESDGPPAGLGGYLFVMAVFIFFAFMLSHARADRELEFDLATFARDVRWGAALGLLYWAESLASRTIVIDPQASVEINLGFNSREVGVLALAVLTAGVVVGVRQSKGLAASGWTVLGPLLGFRFLYDLLFAMQISKTRSQPIVR